MREPAITATPLTDSFVVIDNFLPNELAAAMRSDLERNFANPHEHQAETHQIWNYWFVPSLYTYLRTYPEKIIEHGRVEKFVDTLRSWSSEVLGFGKVTWPYLSLYINGCQQGLHNDSKNGRFAFVYSLTKLERQTTGGQTLIFREGDLFRRGLRSPGAGSAFYEAIEPRFNRLVVFDDRLIHGVERVSGSLDPSEARCVLHGHFEEAGPIVVGPLPIEALRESILAAMDQFVAQWAATMSFYHGPLVLRFTVTPNGKVAGMSILLDRVIQERGGDIDWDSLKASLVETLSRATFPTAGDETRITLPVAFGGRV
jgi:2-oxoglutarate-Fe(II)-dependent oxygenase superfamily protein